MLFMANQFEVRLKFSLWSHPQIVHQIWPLLHVGKLRNRAIPGIPHKSKLVVGTENIRAHLFTNLPSQEMLQAASLIFIFKPTNKPHPKVFLRTTFLFRPNHILNRCPTTLRDVNKNTFLLVRNHNNRIEESAHGRCQGSSACHRGSQCFMKRSHSVIPFEE